MLLKATTFHRFQNFIEIFCKCFGVRNYDRRFEWASRAQRGRVSEIMKYVERALRTRRKSVDRCFRHGRLSVEGFRWAHDMDGISCRRPKLSGFVLFLVQNAPCVLTLLLTITSRRPQISRRARDRRSRGGGLSAICELNSSPASTKVSLILFVKANKSIGQRGTAWSILIWSAFVSNCLLPRNLGRSRAYLGLSQGTKDRMSRKNCRINYCIVSFVTVIDILYFVVVANR